MITTQNTGHQHVMTKSPRYLLASVYGVTSLRDLAANTISWSLSNFQKYLNISTNNKENIILHKLIFYVFEMYKVTINTETFNLKLKAVTGRRHLSSYPFRNNLAAQFRSYSTL